MLKEKFMNISFHNISMTVKIFILFAKSNTLDHDCKTIHISESYQFDFQRLVLPLAGMAAADCTID